MAGIVVPNTNGVHNLIWQITIRCYNKNMKHYIVYLNGQEQKELITAGSHNAAEKKAQKKYCSSPWLNTPSSVQVVYTEI